MALKNSLWGVWDALLYDSFIWTHGLRRADKIPTDMTGAEKRLLYELVIRNEPKTIVEIGSFLGASTSFLARAAQRLSPPANVIAVDTWNNDAMPDGTRDTFKEFNENTRPYRHLISTLRSTSHAAAIDFEHKIDFLFIDGDHTYEAVLTDWGSWNQYLRGDAIVVMHDCGWAEGVQRVIDESIHPLAQSQERLPNLYWAKLNPKLFGT